MVVFRRDMIIILIEFQEFITEYNGQKCLFVYSQKTQIYTFIIHNYNYISTNQRPSL